VLFRSEELRQRTGELSKAIEMGDERAMDETIDDMLRILAEIEASA